MDYSTRPRPKFTVATIARALTKFLRLRPSKPRKLGLCDSTCTATTTPAAAVTTPTTITSHGIIDDQKPKTKLASVPNCVVEGEDDDAKAEARRQRREAAEAVLAELFAGASAVKAAYAQLQAAQSPYDGGAIQSADRSVVAELQAISELKQGYIKGHLCPHSRESRMVAELQEVKSLVRTYELVVHKLQNQFNSKSSEVAELREELHELSERTSLSLSPIAHFHFSALNPTHFVGAVREARKSIRGFTKVVVDEMTCAGWCLPSAATSAAAASAVPAAAWTDLSHQLLAFESFVSKQLFAGFQHPGFDECRRRRNSPAEYFDQFAAVVADPESAELAEFVRAKYFSVIHPRMESSLFGDLGHRTTVMPEECPSPDSSRPTRKWPNGSGSSTASPSPSTRRPPPSRPGRAAASRRCTWRSRSMAAVLGWSRTGRPSWPSPCRRVSGLGTRWCSAGSTRHTNQLEMYDPGSNGGKRHVMRRRELY